MVLDFPPNLFLATAIGEALLEEAVLQLLPEGHQVALKLHLVLDPPRLQVGIYVVVTQLAQHQPRQTYLCISQQRTRTLRVDPLEAEGPQFLLLDWIFVELVEDEVQNLLGGTLIAHEDGPQAVGDEDCGGCVVLRRGEDDQLTEGGIEVLLVVVVWTRLHILPPLALLLPSPIIPAHFSNNQSRHCFIEFRLALLLSSRLQIVQLGQLLHSWLH